MAGNPNKLSRLWEELKQRNVIRVLTIYIAIAFMLLELLDMISEPFALPGWSMKVGFFVLLAGLIITGAVSWIYDIQPEEGIVKTEDTHIIKKEEIPKSSNNWKIASYISFVVIVGLIVLNIITSSGKKEILDKSIAVLPFIDDSPDKDNEHIINGIMEDLLINLQSIKELRVPGRTSTEQYRNNPKPIPEIANEMNVAYIVEGSGQRYGDRIRLRIQLVEGATDQHIWADSYDEVIFGPEDIFRIQSQLAESIAKELQAVITPEEMDLIEKVPTTSLIAYDLYHRGREEHAKYSFGSADNEALERSEDLYYKALEYDSTFALAYTGLALIYYDNYYDVTYFSEDYLDSVLILADIALSYDDQLSEAYSVKGNYYLERGNTEQAEIEFNTALRYNSNDWSAYYGIGLLYTDEDIVKSIENFQKAVSLNRGPELPTLLSGIAFSYVNAGFVDKSTHYYRDVLNLENDSMYYYYIMAWVEYTRGEYAKAIEFGEKCYAIDSTNINLLNLFGTAYTLIKQYEHSLKYFEYYIEQSKVVGNPLTVINPLIGYNYWIKGDKETAEYYFSEHINYYEKEIELGRWRSQNFYTYYDLACVYAFLGDTNKAYKNLRIFNQRQFIELRFVTHTKNNPLLDGIRDEPEFQQIVRDMEAKYHAEHERVRQWLEENELL